LQYSFLVAPRMSLPACPHLPDELWIEVRCGLSLPLSASAFLAGFRSHHRNVLNYYLNLTVVRNNSSLDFQLDLCRGLGISASRLPSALRRRVEHVVELTGRSSFRPHEVSPP